MCRSMVYIQSPTAEIRRGKKKKKKMERNYRMKIYMVSLLHRATINNRLLSINRLIVAVLLPMLSQLRQIPDRWNLAVSNPAQLNDAVAESQTRSIARPRSRRFRSPNAALLPGVELKMSRKMRSRAVIYLFIYCLLPAYRCWNNFTQKCRPVCEAVTAFVHQWH